MTTARSYIDQCPRLTVLTTLMRRKLIPTLGEIRNCLGDKNGDLVKVAFANGVLTERRALAGKVVMDEYDLTFADRPDYVLWQGVDRATDREWPKAGRSARRSSNALGLAYKCLNDRRPEVYWGLLCTIRHFLNFKSVPDEQRSEYLDFAHSLEAVLYESRTHQAGPRAPLPGCPAFCALAELLALVAIENYRDKCLKQGSVQLLSQNPRQGIDQARELIDHVEQRLKIIDSEWVSGWRINDQRFRLGRDGKPGLHPDRDRRKLFPVSEYTLSRWLRDSLRAIRFIAIASIWQIEGSLWDSATYDDAVALLKRLALLARTAWLCSRSLRFGQERLFETQPLRKPIDENCDGSVTTLYSQELESLWDAYQAADEAGWPVVAAGLAYLLLWSLPEQADRAWTPQLWEWFDGPMHSPRPSHARFEYRLGKKCENVGLEIPEWVSTNKQCAGPQGLQKKLSPFQQHIKIEQAIDPRWKPLFEQLPTQDRPHRVLGRALDEINMGACQKPEVIFSAIDLSIDHGRIKEAIETIEKVAPHYRPPTSLVLKLAKAVTAAGRLIPFGLHVESHKSWTATIRRLWANSPELMRDGMNVDDAMILHEACLGRCTKLMRTEQQSTMLVQKFYGKMSSRSRKNELDDIRVWFNVNHENVTSASVQQWLRERAKGSLGAPAVLSVVNVSDPSSSTSRFSIVAIGRTRARMTCVSLSNPEPLARRAMSPSLCNNLKYNPWDSNAMKPLNQLAAAIADAAGQVDSDGLWLAVAIEPSLAVLPWNDLIRAVEYSKKPPLVSLIPSVGWVIIDDTFQHRRTWPGEIKLIVASEELFVRGTDDERRALIDLRNAVLNQSGYPSDINFGPAVVLGHGTWLEDERFTSIVAPDRAMPLINAESEDDGWTGVVQHRWVLAHACYGGTTDHAFVGDLAGPAGLALGFGCRLFVAPVAEVPAAVALNLHRKLFESQDQSIGERYLKAVNEDRSVGIYNLYGLPDEMP